MARLKPLSAKAINELKAKYIAADIQFVSHLHNLQVTSFPKRLKDIGEWSDAEKIKRLILGLHEKTEIDHKQEITFKVIR